MRAITKYLKNRGFSCVDDGWYLEGTARVDGERRVKQEGESVPEALRRACDAILDFFDAQLGEGKAEELFGLRVNVKTIFDGFREFTGQVNACIGDYARSLRTDQAAPVNRAQRREEKRRNR